MATPPFKIVHESVPASPAKRRGRPPGKTHASVIPKTLGIVDMVTLACSRVYLVATVIGAAFGGFVPLGVYWLAHRELSLQDGISVGSYVIPVSSALALVFGGLAFSALTVAQWALLAFGSRIKAFGFMVFVEGIMTTSRTPWLAVTALVYLMIINAIASGVMMARGSRRWNRDSATDEPSA